MTLRSRTLIGLSLTLAMVLGATVALAGNRPGLVIVPFNARLYETGYKIFLMNQDIADALTLAEAAVKAKPTNRLWHRRAALCADWTEHLDVALREWTWLALHTGNAEAFSRAMTIAKAQNALRVEHALLRYQVKRHLQLETLRAFVRTGEKLGALKSTIRFLQQRQEGKFRKYVLDTLAQLYQESGFPGKAIRLLQKRDASRPLPVGQLLRLARLQYTRGDVQGAYRTLKNARSGKAASNRQYLEALSDLCWLVQDIPCARQASAEIVVRGEGREEDYQRLIYFDRADNVPEAFKLSRAAWRKFKKPWFFGDLTTFGADLGRWRELEKFIASMKRSDRIELAQNSSFWLIRSRIYRHLGKADAALDAFRQALRLRPGDPETTASYIWLLLDLHKTGRLREVFSRWMEQRTASEQLIEALAAAAESLGDSRRALLLYRKIYGRKKNDPLWLASYADVLAQNDLKGEAFAQRLRALAIVRRGLQRKDLPPAGHRELRRHLAGLLLDVAKGDRLAGLMRQIMRGPQSEATRELVAAWALSSGNDGLARWWFWKAYARESQSPAWVRLDLALQENDRQELYRLLRTDAARLPYRDAIEAARRIGDRPLAEQIAWDSRWRNPDDEQLYGQLRELFQLYPSFADYKLRLLDQGGLGGVENTLSISRPITSRFTLFSRFRQTQHTALKGG